MSCRHLMLLSLAACAVAGAAVAGPLADYGDAADPPYPSLFGSPNAGVGLNSPFHLDVQREWLGLSATSTTTTELDSAQVDVDVDDSGSRLFLLNGTRGYLYTTASYDPALSPANAPRYLNAVVDLDGDGDFGDILPGTSQREWVVRNAPIDFSLLPAGENQLNIYAGFHLDSTFANLQDRQLRVTISTEAVPTPSGEWDGSGPLAGFARGETEDLLIDVETATLDEAGIFNGPVGIGGQKNIGPLNLRWVPYVPAIDGRHALTPVAPAGPAPVGEFQFNVGAAAADPTNALGGAAVLGWVRTCDIGAGDCVHLPFMGPNSPTATLLGSTSFGGGAMTLGAVDIGIFPLVQGRNVAVVSAQFPNPVNGDTHTFMVGLVDPMDTFYYTVQMDDCGLYPLSSACEQTQAHLATVAEPEGMLFFFGGLVLLAAARHRRV